MGGENLNGRAAARSRLVRDQLRIPSTALYLPDTCHTGAIDKLVEELDRKTGGATR